MIEAGGGRKVRKDEEKDRGNETKQGERRANSGDKSKKNKIKATRRTM